MCTRMYSAVTITTVLCTRRYVTLYSVVYNQHSYVQWGMWFLKIFPAFFALARCEEFLLVAGWNLKRRNLCSSYTVYDQKKYLILIFPRLFRIIWSMITWNLNLSYKIMSLSCYQKRLSSDSSVCIFYSFCMLILGYYYQRDKKHNKSLNIKV